MSDSANHSTKLEVYRNAYDTWRFEVDSYWQRNVYFAAFETAAIGGCWYLLEHQKLSIGLVFAVLGTGLTLTPTLRTPGSKTLVNGSNGTEGLSR
jgi:hypothetical protein